MPSILEDIDACVGFLSRSDICESTDYHIILMTICQPASHEQWDNSLNPRDIAANAERDLNILMRLYHLRHGFSHGDSYVVFPLSKLGLAALENIKTQQSLEELNYARSTLFLALEGLRKQGHSYYVTRTMYYLLKSQLRPQEEAVLHGSENLEPAPEESPGLLGEVHSAWIPWVADTLDDADVQELLESAK
jgi:hypothetical protein